MSITIEQMKKLSEELDTLINNTLLLDDLLNIRDSVESLRFYDICKFVRLKSELNEVKNELILNNGINR